MTGGGKEDSKNPQEAIVHTGVKMVATHFHMSLKNELARLIFNFFLKYGLSIENSRIIEYLKEYLEKKDQNSDIQFLIENFSDIQGYFEELIIIVKEIYKLHNENHSITNINEFARSFLNRKGVISKSLETLIKNIRSIIDDFNDTIDGFRLERRIRSSDDDIVGFDRPRFKELYPLVSADETSAVLAYLKKKQLIKDLCELKGIPQLCENCGCSLENLPSTDSHHINSEKKEISWSDVRRRAYREILQSMRKEEIKILCTDCHLLEHSKLFFIYSDLLKEFNVLLEEKLNSIIKQREPLLTRDQFYARKNDIKSFLKFGWIMENIFDNMSVGSCFQLSVKNFPIFILHHRGKKTADWKDMRYKPLSEIVSWIYNDDLAPLIASEHTLIHSTIFQKYLDFIEPEYSAKLQSQIDLMKLNIDKFRHPDRSKLQLEDQKKENHFPFRFI